MLLLCSSIYTLSNFTLVEERTFFWGWQVYDTLVIATTIELDGSTPDLTSSVKLGIVMKCSNFFFERSWIGWFSWKEIINVASTLVFFSFSFQQLLVLNKDRWSCRTYLVPLFFFFHLFFNVIYFYPMAETSFSCRIGQYAIFPPLRQEAILLKISDKTQPHE